MDGLIVLVQHFVDFLALIVLIFLATPFASDYFAICSDTTGYVTIL